MNISSTLISAIFQHSTLFSDAKLISVQKVSA